MEKILIIDDDVDTCSLLTRFLTKNGYVVDSAYTGSSALQKFEKENAGVVLCDFRLGDMDGRDVLKKIKAINPATQVIIITGYSDVKIAVEVIKAGAVNYVTKPLLPEEILLNVKEAVRRKNGDAGDTPGKDGESTQPGVNSHIYQKNTKNFHEAFIEGESLEAKNLYHQVDLVAPTNYSVIIYGESGTGKESIAKRIHENSKRSAANFVAVDCGVLSKELAASELFGHEKGSFTGALNSKTGSFEHAHGGTLFLDEVGNLSYEVQMMLLRAVQEKKIRKVGGLRDIPVDVRIIVASNESLFNVTKTGRFREDLYHRFNEFTINMPALRERNVDIMIFANFFLKRACVELEKSVHKFSEEVETLFYRYPWPGNLRELNNIVKRATLLTPGDIIDISALPQELVYAEKFTFPSAGKPQSVTIDELNLKSAALDAEYQVIIETLKKVNYNKTKAARILNVDRKTLYNKMKQYDIKVIGANADAENDA